MLYVCVFTVMLFEIKALFEMEGLNLVSVRERYEMKTIYLVCDITLHKGTSFFDYLYQLETTEYHFVLVTPDITRDARNALENKGYKYERVSNVVQLMLLLRESPANMIHFHFYGIGHLYLLCSRLLCSNIILTAHQSLPKEKQPLNVKSRSIIQSALVRVKRRVLILFLRRTVAVSSFINRWLINDIPSRSVVKIENGINLQRFSYVDLPPVSTTLNCFFVGHLSEEKGVCKLLYLFSDSEISKVANISIIGDGPMQEEVKQAAKKFSSITYLGPSEYVEQDLTDAHILLVPSQWQEAFGYVAVESMAMGRPVLAQPTGGLGELFSHSNHSWYVDFNDKGAVENVLKALLSQPELIRITGIKAHRWVHEHYSLTRQINQTHALYSELLN